MATTLSLEKQCALIGWPLVVTPCVKSSDAAVSGWEPVPGLRLRAEEVVARSFIDTGASVCWCEGASVKLLMKAACLDFLADRNIFKDRADAVRRALEAQCHLLESCRSEIVHAVRNASSGLLLRNLGEICADPFVAQCYPRATFAFMRDAHAVLTTEWLARVAAVFVEKPYDYRAGWPDLLVIKDARVFFVEVKTTDRLHASQLRFADEVANPLGFECRVVRVVPEKTASV